MRRSVAAVLASLSGIVGASLGVAIAPPTAVDVGPLSGTVQLRPSLQGVTEFQLPPFGTVTFDTHHAPIKAILKLDGVDIAGAERLIASQEEYEQLESTAVDTLAGAAMRNALVQVSFATIGGALGALIVLRGRRETIIGAGSALVLAVGSTGLLAVTFDADGLSQPQFDGVLTEAANLMNIGQGGITDYANYREQVADMVSQASGMYIAGTTLPSAFDRDDVITVLHVSDIHANPQAFDVMQSLDEQFGVDLIIDTGDAVSWATPIENSVLDGLDQVSDVPYVFVAGNHDSAATVEAIGAHPNVTVLSNEVVQLEGLTIAGIGDPRFVGDDTSDGVGFAAGKDAVEGAGYQLGETIEDWDSEHPEDPVDIALLHDPTRPAGLLGRAPLVLSGHMHTPNVEIDREGSGTDWITSGSTGGALTSGGVEPVASGGRPLDLSARLLHIDRATGKVLAMDEITMGGLGLMSISVERVQLPEESPELQVPDGAESPEEPIPSEQVVTPGEIPADEQRITPEESSDAGGAQDTDGDAGAVPHSTFAPDPGV